MHWQPIQTIVDVILKSDDIHLGDVPELSKTGKSSIHAVLRTVLGLRTYIDLKVV